MVDVYLKTSIEQFLQDETRYLYNSCLGFSLVTPESSHKYAVAMALLICPEEDVAINSDFMFADFNDQMNILNILAKFLELPMESAGT